MLLACAFAFVYLLAWQFQWSDIVRRWHGDTRQAITQTTQDTQVLPDKLEKIPEESWTKTNSWEIKPTIDTQASLDKGRWSQTGGIWAKNSWTQTISFTSLNAVPQSFMRLWISGPAGIMMDTQRIIVTTNTNTIKRASESKTLTADQIKQIWLTVDSLTFYNDPSRANILVLMEVVHNNQSLLIQAPYAVYRDDKAHLNSLIAQLTQK